jgi:hypothetical protein
VRLNGLADPARTRVEVLAGTGGRPSGSKCSRTAAYWSATRDADCRGSASGTAAYVSSPTRRRGAPAVLQQRGRPVRRHLVRRPSGFRTVTSACVADGRLMLGSVRERGVAVCELPGGTG